MQIKTITTVAGIALRNASGNTTDYDTSELNNLHDMKVNDFIHDSVGIGANWVMTHSQSTTLDTEHQFNIYVTLTTVIQY